MLIASDYVTLSIGAAVALGSVAVGAMIEGLRERASWRRQERSRWSNDLRIVYRDLIGNGDTAAARMRSVVTAKELFRVKDMGDVMDRDEIKERWLGDVKKLLAPLGEGAAEIDLIASDAERDVAHRFVKALNDFAFALEFEATLVPPPSFNDADGAYLKCRADLVREARRSLRQGDPT